MNQKTRNFSIAYVVQNAAPNIYQDVGATVLVKNTLRYLNQAGHQTSYIALEGRSVIGIDDVSDTNNKWYAQQGLAGTKPFLLFESGIRRFQREVRLPYFAVFDSIRFYHACSSFLPRFDICHEHQGLFSIGAALACWRLNIPYVVTFDADILLEKKIAGQQLTGLHASVAEWEVKLSLKSAKRIICVSKQAKRQLIENWQIHPDKITVLPNGVDTDLFRPSEDRRAAKKGINLAPGPVITFVSGFQPWHGLEQLIETFTLVLNEVPNARLLLVGDGPTRPHIEELISNYGVDSSVTITGLIPIHRVPLMLEATDIAVIPYPRLPEELWFSPLKLYEYMAAGKAIVASRSGQIAEVLQDGHTGLLIDTDDLASFAKAIVFLVNSPEERQRLGKNARAQAVERHSWQYYVSRLEDVYRDVLDISTNN